MADRKHGVADAWRALGMRCAALIGVSTALFSLLNNVNVLSACLRGLVALVAVRVIVSVSGPILSRLERARADEPRAGESGALE